MNGAKQNHPLGRLRHHVTGAIERGEAEAIVERKPVDVDATLVELRDRFVNLRELAGFDAVAEPSALVAKANEARDAVTELIEAAEHFATWAVDGEPRARLRAALERCGVIR